MIDLSRIVAKEGIGEGGNWKVYRCLLQDCSSVIVKESKGFVDMAKIFEHRVLMAQF